MKIASKIGCLYAVIAILALTCVGLDHYVVNRELQQFELDNIANQQQFMDMCQATGTIQFAEKAQEVALQQSRKLQKLDDLLAKYAEGVKQLKEENARLQAVLEESAETIKGLTDENAKLGAQLDVRLEDFNRLVTDLKEANKTIKTLEATINSDKTTLTTLANAKEVAEKRAAELEQKLNDALNNVKCLTDDLKKATTGA